MDEAPTSVRAALLGKGDGESEVKPQAEREKSTVDGSSPIRVRPSEVVMSPMRKSAGQEFVIGTPGGSEDQAMDEEEVLEDRTRAGTALRVGTPDRNPPHEAEHRV